MSKGFNVVSFAAGLFVLAVGGSAMAAGYCSLPDGSMGQQCVVQSSGQVYGCVKDLKDCGALSPVKPSGSASAKIAPLHSGLEDGGVKKSKSNLSNN